MKSGVWRLGRVGEMEEVGFAMASFFDGHAAGPGLGRGSGASGMSHCRHDCPAKAVCGLGHGTKPTLIQKR